MPKILLITKHYSGVSIYTFRTSCFGSPYCRAVVLFQRCFSIECLYFGLSFVGRFVLFQNVSSIEGFTVQWNLLYSKDIFGTSCFVLCTEVVLFGVSFIRGFTVEVTSSNFSHLLSVVFGRY